MDVRPIRTEADYKAALAEIETLMNATMGSPEGDRLDVLATLAEAYETVHVPIEAPDPISAILFMMEQKQLSRRDLEPAIGSRARVAEVLNRRRPLTFADDPGVEPRFGHSGGRADPAVRDAGIGQGEPGVVTGIGLDRRAGLSPRPHFTSRYADWNIATLQPASPFGLCNGGNPGHCF